MDEPGETETPSTVDQLAAETNRKLAECVEKLVAIESQKMAEQEMEAARKQEKETEAKDTSVNAIPEILLTPLLGFSGLRWVERENLHPLFAQLHAAKTRKERYALLRAFFNKLGKAERSFTGFSNTRVFDDIINLKFAPGLTAVTAGEGVGILSFTPMDIHEMRAAEEEAEAYDEATVITTTDSRKKKVSKRVYPPMTLSDLLSMLRRYNTFCQELWSTDSQWTYHVTDLFDRLETNQHMLGMAPTTSRTLATEVTWAVMVEANKFFSQTVSRADLEQARPRFAKSTLRAHTDCFENGIPREVAGMPPEWKQKPKLPPLPPLPSVLPPRPGGRRREDAPDARGDAGRHNRPRQGFAPAEQPAAFRESRELRELRERIHGITLNRICQAARINSPTELGRRCNVSEASCMAYNVTGTCRFQACERDHTTPITNQQAEAVYRLILPGIRALLPPPAGR
jgi:hypothetical protein